MSEPDVSWEENTWQEPARWTKRRVRLILTFVALVALGVVAINKRTEKHAHLTAVDRATGVRRWRDTLPAAGAAVMIGQEAAIGIGTCGSGDTGGWLVVDPSTGKVVHDRDWRPTDGDPALVSVWIDPAPIQDPITVPEFSYDRASSSLVAAKGWTVKVHVSGGYPRHIPILVVGDSVYFIENASSCSPGMAGRGN